MIPGFSALVLILAVAVVALVFVFSKVRPRDHGPNSFTLPKSGNVTELDKLLTRSTSNYPEKTRLSLVTDDVEAFKIRYDLAHKAGRSLDLQYYYWKADLTGRILGRELLRAADRGVRVRLLLDDINARGFDRTYLALNTHPLIEVRLFNPSRSRTSQWRRGIELVFHYFSATRRMHNKSWIADGRVAVVGGRNIGDAYFGASDVTSFRDADLLAVGPVVDDVEAIFDSYWNSDAALPITSLHTIRHGKLAKLRRRLDHHCSDARASTYMKHLDQSSARTFHQHLANCLCVESAEVIADPPEKAATARQDDWISLRIFELVQGAQHSLELASPYFIPGRAGLKIFSGLVTRGVRTRVLTNSLASTDVMIVHSAYARYRRILVENGIEVFEHAPRAGRRRISLFGSSTASLHTKAFVTDNQNGFVGSFNLDPRSMSINTEMGIIFNSDDLATQLKKFLETQMQASYRITIADGSLHWIEQESLGDQSLTKEPMAPPLRRAVAWLVGFLPIESQL